MRLSRFRAMQTLTAAVTTAPAWMARADAQVPAAISAAMIPIEPAALIYYARENGYFSKAGLNVTVAQNPSTPALVSAVAAGTYDIAYATISTLAVAHAHGLPFVLIAPGVGVKPGVIAGAIMVPPNSPIQSAKDFNGKTFGCAALNTIAEYLPRAWVDKHGGDSSTMKFVEVPFPQEVPAMTAGRIDACYLVEPFLTMSLKQQTAKLLTTGDDPFGSSYLATGWYATEQWAKAHAEIVARFAGAMKQAGAWANANPAKVVPILVDELHVDPAITAQCHRAYFPPTIVPKEMQSWIDVTAHYGRFAPFNAAELIYKTSRTPTGRASGI